MFVVSSCLLGNSKYNGGNNYNEKLLNSAVPYEFVLDCAQRLQAG